MISQTDYNCIQLLSLSLLICRMGLAPPPLSIWCAPEDRIRVGKLCKGQGAKHIKGKNARGGAAHGFLCTAFSMGSEFTAESSKVQPLKGAN